MLHGISKSYLSQMSEQCEQHEKTTLDKLAYVACSLSYLSQSVRFDEKNVQYL